MSGGKETENRRKSSESGSGNSEEENRKKRKQKKQADSGTEDTRKKKKASKRKRKESSDSVSDSSSSGEDIDNYDRLATIWKYEARPRFMQKRKIVNRMEWKEIMDTRREYREECRASGIGEATFMADATIPTKKYAACKDNRADKLHPASMLRLPILEPAEYWRGLPRRREPLYRDLPLNHCNGNIVINELAIVRLHDRGSPVTLRMFMDTNFAKRPGREVNSTEVEWEAPTKLRAAQSALFSYQAALRHLWPMDATPETICQTLVKADWGGSQRTDLARATMVELLFNRIMVENAARAAKGKPPADYRRAKEIWEDVVEAQPKPVPTISSAQHGSGNNSGAHRGGRGASRGGRFGQEGRQTAAKSGGLFVCHAYNDPIGCKRDKQGPGCKNVTGMVFAHCCNFKKPDGEYCLALHERHKHH